jgi:hypothetical protein
MKAIPAVAANTAAARSFHPIETRGTFGTIFEFSHDAVRWQDAEKRFLPLLYSRGSEKVLSRARQQAVARSYFQQPASCYEPAAAARVWAG